MAKRQRTREHTTAVQESSPQHADDTIAATISRARVAERAYELYLARGGADGQAMDDWLSAERELRGRVKAR
jgi:hypothetical protein